MKILDNYIKQLIENSTPQEPAWNIEKIRAGKPNTWNYIDGCMIKALITFYDITKDERYLQFADNSLIISYRKTDPSNIMIPKNTIWTMSMQEKHCTACTT